MKRMVTIILMVTLGLLLGGPSDRPVAAAFSVSVTKRVSVASQTSAQQTVPLAGARYRLVHVVAAQADVPIDPRKVSTYRVSDTAPLDVVLTTNRDGIARLSGTALVSGHYVLAELRTSQVTAPARPVLATLSAQAPVFAYSPKSGLVSLDVATGDNRPAEQEARIMQTSGRVTPLPWRRLLALGLLSLMASAVLAAGLRRRREVSAIDTQR
ncbi:hypothetical protein [Lacticaseibacillus absianus]|uniref:hypothetical protein n=1 Tax=Lacticaseibacillus absianus TaxID=2729623 RepID=UPI0015CA87E2|nr:hypothetical protein [Lacticaseibacillus absianus]